MADGEASKSRVFWPSIPGKSDMIDFTRERRCGKLVLNCNNNNNNNNDNNNNNNNKIHQPGLWMLEAAQEDWGILRIIKGAAGGWLVLV